MIYCGNESSSELNNDNDIFIWKKSELQEEVKYSIGSEWAGGGEFSAPDSIYTTEWSFKNELISKGDTWGFKYPESGNAIDAVKRGKTIYFYDNSMIGRWSDYHYKESAYNYLATFTKWYIKKENQYFPRQFYML